MSMTPLSPPSSDTRKEGNNARKTIFRHESLPNQVCSKAHFDAREFCPKRRRPMLLLALAVYVFGVLCFIAYTSASLLSEAQADALPFFRPSVIVLLVFLIGFFVLALFLFLGGAFLMAAALTTRLVVTGNKIAYEFGGQVTKSVEVGPGTQIVCQKKHGDLSIKISNNGNELSISQKTYPEAVIYLASSLGREELRKFVG